MGLDLRIPIGLMFSLVGILLAGYGLMTKANTEIYKRSLDININLYWGLFLLAFGIVMLAFAMKSAGKAKPEQPQ